MKGAPLWTRWILGFDLDGTLVDHTENRLRAAKKLGHSVKKNEASSDVMKKMMSEAEYRELQRLLYDDPEFAFAPPLHAGAMRALQSVRAAGIPYFLVSRRKKAGPAIELMKARGLWPEFFNEKNAFFVLEKKDKDAKAQELGITAYIDDEPSVLAELASVKHKFLFDPVGAHAKGSGDYAAIRSWPEFIMMITQK
ncbi:MAG TPA: hypothetical protein VNG29_03045 [Candidatus Paceibacterota bacterium]|nr:hypothetical protein [Candidatus Paceibacterota bacterium]